MNQKRYTLKPLLLCTLLLLAGPRAWSQLVVLGTPPSWNQQLKSSAPVPTLRLPQQDNNRLLEAAYKAAGPQLKRLKFGEPVELVTSAADAGVWTRLPDGTDLWRLRIASAGAKHLSVYFTAFRLPKGAVLYLYPDDQQGHSGAITALNNQADGQQYLAPIAGDALTLELAIDPARRAELQLSIGHVVHGFRDFPFALRNLMSFGSAASCHPDAVCTTPATLANSQRAVGVVLFANGANCTGTLVNNTTGDGRPLFLTADHCESSINNRHSAIAVLFNYKRSNCGFGAATTTQGIGGASLLARTRASLSESDPVATDFALFQLNRRPPASFNAFYAGWNRTLTPGSITSSHGFSHPCGDAMKFSISASSPSLTSLIDGTFTETFGSNYWKVFWTSTTATEPGSSGSALFDSQQRIIGQLLGGASYCAGASTCRTDGGTAYISGPDYYGTIGASWTGAGSMSNRLSDHLDPMGTNPQTLDGANTPNPAPAGYCFSGAEDEADSRIDRVRLGTLDVTTASSGCVRYTDLTSNAASLTAGQSYSLIVNKGTCGGNFSYTAKVFIDWNNDKDFDDANELVASAATSGSTAISTSIVVPSSVVNGVATVMRVVVRERLNGETEQNSLDNTLPCDIYPWGETEDYRINLVNMTTALEDVASGLNDPSLEVYPNPATGPVTVRWTVAEANAPVLLSIMSPTGASSLSGTLQYDSAQGAYTTQLDGSLLAPGSYVVRVGSRERQASRRLVVVR